MEKRAPQPEELQVGTKVLVHFPFLRNSKFFSKWKHIYRIVEVVDLNCFIVQEEGQPRKRYIVDRRRLRIIGPKISKEDLETIEDINEEDTDQIEESTKRLETIPEEPRENHSSHETTGLQDDADRPSEPTRLTGYTEPQEPITIREEVSSEDDKEEKTCEIEFEVPTESSIPKEVERPRRKAAIRAKTKIRGWTKELLND